MASERFFNLTKSQIPRRCLACRARLVGLQPTVIASRASPRSSSKESWTRVARQRAARPSGRFAEGKTPQRTPQRTLGDHRLTLPSYQTLPGLSHAARLFLSDVVRPSFEVNSRNDYRVRARPQSGEAAARTACVSTWLGERAPFT